MGYSLADRNCTGLTIELFRLKKERLTTEVVSLFLPDRQTTLRM